MYKYTFSEEDSDRIKNIAMSAEELKNKFKKVDDKYHSSPRTVDTTPLILEKMTYEKPTKEKVQKDAEDALSEYKTSSISGIDSDYKTKATNIDKQLEETKKNADSEKEELATLYASLKKNASEDAIKRGLARSSIIVNTLEAFDKSMLDNFVKINDELQKTFSDLNAEKSLLEEQKQSALSAFDISYAVKLNQKIDDINTKITEEEQKVLKYNNEIAQKEADYAKEDDELKNKYAREDRADNLEFLEYLTDNGTIAYEDTKASEKYEYAYEILKDLPKEDAISELESDTDYRKNLGRYYDRLISILKNKAN